MLNKEKLPFEINVEMRMYHNKSFPLGAIKANLTDYDVWVSNKLINCVWRKTKVLDTIEEDIWSTRDGLSFSQGMWMKPSAFAINGFNLIEFNKNMIQQGYYITGGYNEYFIPNKGAYQNYNFNHDYIIFGYDDVRGVFNSAAYLKNRKYTYYDMDYNDYYNAVVNNDVNKSGLNFYKINMQYKPEISVDIIKKKLYEYGSCNILEDDVDIYGIGAWEKFADYVLNCTDKLDDRFGRGYMEHHYLMLKRIKTLRRLGYEIEEDVENNYEKICIQTRIVHNLIIKYNCSNSTTLLMQISKMILDLIPLELEIIHNIYNALK